jgi:hypothetical protein
MYQIHAPYLDMNHSRLLRIPELTMRMKSPGLNGAIASAVYVTRGIHDASQSHFMHKPKYVY